MMCINAWERVDLLTPWISHLRKKHNNYLLLFFWILPNFHLEARPPRKASTKTLRLLGLLRTLCAGQTVTRDCPAKAALNKEDKE